MRKIFVRNSEGDTREVSEDKVHLAEGDGFLPVVSNGSRETRVSMPNFEKARADGFLPLDEIRNAEGEATRQAERQYEIKNNPLVKGADFLNSASAMMDDYNPLTGITDRAKAGINAITSDDSYDQSLKDIRADRQHEMGKSKAGRVVGAGIGLAANAAAQGGGKLVNGALGFAEGVSRSEDMLSLEALKNGAIQGSINVGLPLIAEAAPAIIKGVKNAPGAIANAVEDSVPLVKAGARGAFNEIKKAPDLADLALATTLPQAIPARRAYSGIKGAAEEVMKTKALLREQKDLARSALKDLETGNPQAQKAALDTLQAQPWPGSSRDLSDADVIASMAMKGGEYNSTADYIAKQAAVFGVPEVEFKKLLEMTPERLEQVANFSKREAGEDAAPLLKNLSETFESVRGARLKELKTQARQEFKGDAQSVLDVMGQANKNALELRTTKGASPIIEDAYEILAHGKGAETFGFKPGDHFEVDNGGLFDRLQAARTHIDDNIDWTAIKRGNRSATPEEKVLMKVRESLDKSLKGGSDSKIESDSLFRASKELENRFFKLTQDKDGVHENSLAKLFGDNDRAVKAKHFMKEMEEFAARPDLPKELKDSTKAFVDKMKMEMSTADDKRLYQEFSRKTRGPTGPSVERLANTLGERNVASQAITTPGTFLDLKTQVPRMAKDAFGKTYSDLNQNEQQALLQLISWKQTKLSKQEAITPQLEAAAWEKIKKGLGL
jgi:hypothetical protein